VQFKEVINVGKSDSVGVYVSNVCMCVGEHILKQLCDKVTTHTCLLIWGLCNITGCSIKCSKLSPNFAYLRLMQCTQS
jgi:hypothetical protein